MHFMTLMYSSSFASYQQSAISCIEMHLNISSLASNTHQPHDNSRHFYDCLLHGHTPQLATKALNTWNPHLILFMLCGIHFIICLSHTRFKHKHVYIAMDSLHQHSNPIDDNVIKTKYSLSLLRYASSIFFLLLVPIIVCQGMHDEDLIKYPTLITMVLYSFIIIYFMIISAYFSDNIDDDYRWGLAFHLQVVSVPLAVLGIATAGGRLWFDVLSHFMLLSAAVNTLWLQTSDQLHGPLAQSICRALTLGLTTLSLYLIHIEFGQFDTWRYVIAYMACVGLAPLFILSLTSSTTTTVDAAAFQFPSPPNQKKCVLKQQQPNKKKIYHNISFMATNAALLSFIVNLGNMSHF